MTTRTLDFMGHGRNSKKVAFPPGIVNRHSRVLASITELKSQDKDTPHPGGAFMTVHNIVPQDDNTVIVYYDIEWDNDLLTRLTVVVLD
jgi:hypothetical protein